MYQTFVQLEKVEDVKRFVGICNGVDFPVELISGDYVVDAKSIMGIFSLNLSQKLALRANCSGEAQTRFADKIGEFLATDTDKEIE